MVKDQAWLGMTNEELGQVGKNGPLQTSTRGDGTSDCRSTSNSNRNSNIVLYCGISVHPPPLEQSWRHCVLGLFVHVFQKFLNKIYKFGSLWDKDELIRF